VPVGLSFVHVLAAWLLQHFFSQTSQRGSKRSQGRCVEEKGADINDELKGRQLKLKKHENTNEMIAKRFRGN